MRDIVCGVAGNLYRYRLCFPILCANNAERMGHKVTRGPGVTNNAVFCSEAVRGAAQIEALCILHGLRISGKRYEYDYD